MDSFYSLHLKHDLYDQLVILHMLHVPFIWFFLNSHLFNCASEHIALFLKIYEVPKGDYTLCYASCPGNHISPGE